MSGRVSSRVFLSELPLDVGGGRFKEPGAFGNNYHSQTKCKDVGNKIEYMKHMILMNFLSSFLTCLSCSES